MDSVNNSSLPDVIAGTYKVTGQLGSGGGGVVYLAEHVRLNKKVVLKADKRSLTTKPEALRREVDALKNLSHTNIPQVYDYIEEDGTVYTVMDYIDGESFDKPLRRGERFSQLQVIRWACRVLSALSYLHSRPPHGILHADIKPSNIMLTREGDVFLIDYNIALALGEEGAVAVGRSFGYASPEHYGLDYSSRNTSKSAARSAKDDNLTLYDPTTGASTVVPPESGSNSSSAGNSSGSGSSGSGSSGSGSSGSGSSGSGSSSGKTILLNVRSDIYSLGATLYHIITGERPSQDVNEIKPISAKGFSPAVISIITKAMNPDQEQRWQSADDMLYAFEHLRDNDPRVRKWKRARMTVGVVLSLALLSGGATVFAGSRQIRDALREGEILLADTQTLVEELGDEIAQKQDEIDITTAEADAAKKGERVQETFVQAGNSADALRSGDRIRAISYALDAMTEENMYNADCIPEAKNALADALGVYDLADGFKPHRTVILPSETLSLVISPDGKSFSAVSFGKLSVYDTQSGMLLTELPAVESGLADVVYADEDNILFAAQDGLTAYRLSAGSALWTGAAATTIALSADGKTAAAVDRGSTTAVIYSTDGGRRSDVDFLGRSLRVTVNDRFGNPGDNIFALNSNGSLLAVSFSDGSLELFDIDDAENGILIFEESGYTRFEGGFFGKYFAFSAGNAEETLFAVIDTEDLVQTIATVMSGAIGVMADEDGIYMSYNGIHVMIDPETAKQTPLPYDPRVQIAGEWRVEGSLNSPTVRISKLISNSGSEIFIYDPDYEHDEARINAAGDSAMLFSFKHFRVYSKSGDIVCETEIPDAEQVYDQQYRRTPEGSYLDVIYNDGSVLRYSGDNGSLISRDSIPAPDLSLYEEFTTETLRITSPLHGTPAAYDLVSGEMIRELEKDAYLAYVTQVGEYVITEYISSGGDRYGLLLDGKTCQTLAYIPNLCDVPGEMLVIDTRDGSLRETRIFSAEELYNSALEIIS